MIYVADGPVLERGGLITGNRPRLGWKNYASSTTTTVTSESDSNPFQNIFNPSTAYFWEAADTSEQVIELTLADNLPCDYIGIARHNFDQDTEIKIELAIGGAFFVFYDWSSVSSSQAIMWLFNPETISGARISIRNNSNPVRIAVLNIGETLVFHQNLYVGHTPITMGIKTVTLGGRSESGQYLGEIVKSEAASTEVSLTNIPPDFYRETYGQILSERPRRPFFFAWRPETYRNEIGYCWITGSPRPENARANGMMSLSVSVEAIL